MTSHSADRKRTPGRPGRNAAEQRPALIDAALACYCREGVAATSFKAIAGEARVTPALLHYYFGGRDQLQRAVIEERVLPLLRGIQQQLQGAGEGMDDFIIAFTDALDDAIAEHPWWPALWVREVLCEGGALREVLIEQVGQAFATTLTERFARAQRDGRLNPALDPRLLLVSLIGLTLFPAAGAPVWRQMLGADDVTRRDLQQHTRALLLRGLELKP